MKYADKSLETWNDMKQIFVGYVARFDSNKNVSSSELIGFLFKLKSNYDIMLSYEQRSDFRDMKILTCMMLSTKKIDFSKIKGIDWNYLLDEKPPKESMNLSQLERLAKK